MTNGRIAYDHSYALVIRAFRATRVRRVVSPDSMEPGSRFAVPVEMVFTVLALLLGAVIVVRALIG
jgi:hypothetical protein